MKKTLVTMLAAAAVVASSFGQGTVNFASGTQTVRKETSPGVFVAVPLADAGQVQLFWAPVGTTDVGLFTAIGASTTVGAASPAGRFVGGTRTIPAGAGLTGIAPGANVALIVRGWIGSSYDNASLRGSTGILLVDTGDPTTVPAGTPTAITTGAPGFTGLTLTAVPEPTSMTLAGLGAAALLAFRRRK